MTSATGEPISEKVASRRTSTNLSLEYGTAEAPGYHTLASLMGRDGEYAIFRKFSSLNALNLMSLQAELLELEEQYKMAVMSRKTDSRGVALSTSWKSLHESNSEQKRILLEVREKLAVYSRSFAEHEEVGTVLMRMQILHLLIAHKLLL